jgi:hypothetical protein
MGIWATLFGSPKAVEDITSGIINAGDALVYTAEEKATFTKEVLFKLQDQWMPRAISRRLIAFMITAVFCIFMLTSLVFACFKQPEIVQAIINTAKAFQLGWLQITIVVFYFGYYGFKMQQEKPKKPE